MAMMNTQLNSWMMFAHAPTHFADSEVVTKTGPDTLHRYSLGEFAVRAQQLMHALDRLGIDAGERVATLAWNSYRHLECYFAVPCTARVLHTLNLRLSVEDLTYIIGHADDRVILVDPDLLPILEKIGDGLANVKHIIVLDGTVPETTLSNVIAYEDLIADEPTSYPPKDIAEDTPLGICYTSGTTGRPKGAVYTHRSSTLHSFAATSAAGVGIGPRECVLPIVPMFHANAWGMPHAATMVGAKQVFTGKHLDPASIVDLMAGERVTIAGGVPTIWLAVGEELAARGVTEMPGLKHVVCGGSQPPRPLIERYLNEFNIPIIQAWGMTETNPLASIAWPKEKMRDWPDADVTSAVRTQAGLPVPGIDIAVRDDEGNEVPADGETMGELLVRGPWVIDSYLYDEDPDRFTDDGWFRTGDVAVKSPEGYFVIADRTKDLIKSGGEWISSVDMEGHIMAMPGVAEACVIAIPDDKWQERPLACVVPRAGEMLNVEMVRDHLANSGWAKWQLPDRIEIIEAVPKTSVGKFDKKELRKRFT
ncbi:MAG TPA: long-chain fatty acid--CoA ligase [Actinomycetota bacterium]|nr:long-chain fatty acid--CoA ligase [Actinomycetota bacterium]